MSAYAQGRHSSNLGASDLDVLSLFVLSMEHSPGKLASTSNKGGDYCTKEHKIHWIQNISRLFCLFVCLFQGSNSTIFFVLVFRRWARTTEVEQDSSNNTFVSWGTILKTDIYKCSQVLHPGTFCFMNAWLPAGIRCTETSHEEGLMELRKRQGRQVLAVSWKGY